MPRTCTICEHPSRTEIDAAIAAGTSYRNIAKQFSIGFSAVARHADGHIKQAVKQAKEARDESSALNVVQQLKTMNGIALAILYDARKDKKNHLVALQAMDRVHKQIELQAKLLGDIDEGTHIELHQSPEWLNLRELIFKALEPFPEARIVIAKALYEEAQRGRDVA